MRCPDCGECESDPGRCPECGAIVPCHGARINCRVCLCQEAAQGLPCPQCKCINDVVETPDGLESCYHVISVVSPEVVLHVRAAINAVGGESKMACKNCDHTMQAVADQTWWCPRCGSLKYGVLGETQEPRLVSLVRELLGDGESLSKRTESNLREMVR